MANAAWEHTGGEPGKARHKQSPKVSSTSARMNGITSGTWQQDRIVLSPHGDPQQLGEPVRSSSVPHKADLLCGDGFGDTQQRGCDSRLPMNALYLCSSCASFLLQQLPPLSAQPRPHPSVMLPNQRNAGGSTRHFPSLQDLHAASLQKVPRAGELLTSGFYLTFTGRGESRKGKQGKMGCKDINGAEQQAVL